MVHTGLKIVFKVAEMKIKKLHENAKIPAKAYDSAGYDLFPIESGAIFPGKWKKIKLGFATEFPPELVALIHDRSGVGKHGLWKLCGVIDSDYRGEWMVFLYNGSDQLWTYGPEVAIAQVIFVRHEHMIWRVVDTLGETVRGTAGFGSTDVSGH